MRLVIHGKMPDGSYLELFDMAADALPPIGSFVGGSDFIPGEGNGEGVSAVVTGYIFRKQDYGIALLCDIISGIEPEENAT